jgi:hypothetical protein
MTTIRPSDQQAIKISTQKLLNMLENHHSRRRVEGTFI